MAVVSASVLKSYFEAGDFPTEGQFVDLIDTIDAKVDDVGISTAMAPVVSADSLGSARTALGVEIGEDVQAHDDNLDALSAVTAAADKVVYFTDASTVGLLDFLDEDDLSSDSDTALASQQSIKAYVDNSTSDAARLASGWVRFDGTGTLNVESSHNVDSVDDDGTGDYGVNWTTSFADANYCIVPYSDPTLNTNQQPRHIEIVSFSTAAVELQCIAADGATPEDHEYVSLVAFGSLAS